MNRLPQHTISMLIYDFELPDPDRPIPEEKRGYGPSGELVPFHPEQPASDQVIGRRIDKLWTHVGTYGMGGYGFVGFRLGAEWLVISIFGAGQWIVVDGRQLEDAYHEDSGRPKPWIGEHGDELSEKIVGQTITSFDLRRFSLAMTLSNGMRIEIEESADRRPIFGGSKEPRAFEEDDDLRKAVFFSPTTEIWSPD